MKTSGFSLAELLIVICIIGVLAAVSVPTLRKMVLKSKQTEAQVNLGALYSAEQSFRAEHGGYGNRLSKIGFRLKDPNSLYRIGFPASSACAAAAIAPDVTGLLGAKINSAFPDYYADPGGLAAELANNGNITVLGNSSVATNSLNVCAIQGTMGVPDAPNETNVYTKNVDSDSFTATAMGVLAPGVSRINPPAGDVDVWSITQGGVLTNDQNGVR